jgi:uncharacterized protein YecE (DUF72 family)
MQPRDFLSYCATQFHTVELDNTFYRTPAISTVEGWHMKTAPGFIFAAKVPQVFANENVISITVDGWWVSPSRSTTTEKYCRRVSLI